MKTLQVDDTKPRAVFCICAAVLAVVVMAVINGWWYRLLAGATVVVLVQVAWCYLVSQEVYIDGEDVLVMPRKADAVRFALEEVVSIRTSPMGHHHAWVVLKNTSGGTVRTIILDEDLTWLMSRMPEAALTEYWKRRLGV